MTAQELEEQIEALEAQLKALRGLLLVPNDSISALKQYGKLSKKISKQLKPVRDALEKIGRLQSTTDEYMKNGLASALQHLATSTEQIEEAMKALKKGYSRIPDAAVLIPADIRQERQEAETLSELKEIRTTLQGFLTEKTKASVVGNIRKVEIVEGDKVEGDKIEQHGPESEAKIKSVRFGKPTTGAKRPESFLSKFLWYFIVAIIVGVVLLLISKYIIDPKYGDGLYSTENIISQEISQEASLIENEETTKMRKLDPLETGKYIDDLPSGVYFFASGIEIICELKQSEEYCIPASSRRVIDNFEIQKIDGKYLLIGFIGDESFSKIGSINVDNPLEVVILPVPWNNITKAVGVPFGAIRALGWRRIDVDERSTMGVLDLHTLEVLTSITPHEL